MQTRKNRFSLGGKAIACGGFGCVFSPPLKCKGVERPIGKVVSKLLTLNNADDEFNEAKEIQSILQTNLSLDVYNRYFIFPEKQCEPDALTKDDLENFSKKCTSLTKIGITSKNINKNLHSIGIIELVNGGSDLDKTIKGMKTTTDLRKLNKNIIELLINAIVPMNRMGILHFDLKSGNILADDNSQLRIIDWGLSVISKNNEIPSGSSRPIQYNLPFSTVLFNKKITNEIDKALQNLVFDANYKETIKPDLSAIIHNIVVEKFTNTSRGHIGYVSAEIKKLFNIRNEKSFFIYNLLSNYLTEAVIHFINPKTKTFDSTKYFNEVASKNCDIWGLITVYNDIISHYQRMSGNLPDNLERLRLLVIRYLYSPEFAGKPINVDNLVNDLVKIIPFSGDIRKNNTTKSNSVIDLVSTDSINSNDTKTSSKTVENYTKTPRKSVEIKKNSVDDSVSFDSKKFSVKNGNYNVGDFLSTDSVVNSSLKTKTKKKRNKRCKNGTRRNKKTGECENINGARVSKQLVTTKTESPITAIPSSLLERFGMVRNDVNKARAVNKAQAVKRDRVVIGETKKRNKRCKNGTRRNKKTGECDNIKGVRNEAQYDTRTVSDDVRTVADNVEPPSLFERLGF
jgi:hypothetical protein